MRVVSVWLTGVRARRRVLSRRADGVKLDWVCLGGRCVGVIGDEVDSKDASLGTTIRMRTTTVSEGK